jgi:hypothetical protein
MLTYSRLLLAVVNFVLKVKMRREGFDFYMVFFIREILMSGRYVITKTAS